MVLHDHVNVIAWFIDSACNMPLLDIDLYLHVAEGSKINLPCYSMSSIGKLFYNHGGIATADLESSTNEKSKKFEVFLVFIVLVATFLHTSKLLPQRWRETGIKLFSSFFWYKYNTQGHKKFLKQSSCIS